MHFTQEQISDILFESTNKRSAHLLLNLTLNALMKTERSWHRQEYGNDYRYCKATGHNRELVLKIPLKVFIQTASIGFAHFTRNAKYIGCFPS